MPRTAPGVVAGLPDYFGEDSERVDRLVEELAPKVVIVVTVTVKIVAVVTVTVVAVTVVSVEKSPVFKRACPFKRAFWEKSQICCDFASFFLL